MSSSIIQPSMILTSFKWQEKDSFQLIPVSLECPYQHCIFDPESRSLAVISKTPMQKYTMVPKLDAAGNRIMEFSKDKKPVGYKQERVQMDSYNKYYIDDPHEISMFIRRFAINIDESVNAKMGGLWSEVIWNSFLSKIVDVPPGEITLASGKMEAVKEE